MSRYNQVGTHATMIATGNGYTTIVYHRTPVVRFNAEQIILNSGGYQTHIIKTRMNQASNEYNLDFGVYQKDSAWYVSYKGEMLPFTDGMILTR